MIDTTQVAEALRADRDATASRIAELDRDYRDIIDAAQGGATDDEHDPEGATIAFERAQVSSLLDQARAHLADIDAALQRLGEGSYGTCVRCGQPIAEERLAARPVARACTRCA